MFETKDLPRDRPLTWVHEFRRELEADHRALLDQRTRKAGQVWNFEHAVLRTRQFYQERFTGYCSVGAIRAQERDTLLDLVEKLGTDAFPLSPAGA